MAVNKESSNTESVDVKRMDIAWHIASSGSYSINDSSSKVRKEKLESYIEAYNAILANERAQHPEREGK